MSKKQWPTNIERWRKMTTVDVTHYLGLGADPNVSLDDARYGDHALHLAVRASNVEAYKALLDASPQHLETRNAVGDTLLHIAATIGDVDMVSTLVAAGADLWAQRMVNSRDDYYHEHGCGNELEPILTNEQIKESWGIFDDQQTGEARDMPDGLWDMGETALHIAVYARDMDTVSFLASAGAAEKDFRNQYGESLLHWATLRGHLELMQVLIDGGANVLASNIHGDIPLHWAADDDDPKISRVLILPADGSEQVKNKDGRTPLDVYRARVDGDYYGKRKTLLNDDEGAHQYYTRLTDGRDIGRVERESDLQHKLRDKGKFWGMRFLDA